MQLEGLTDPDAFIAGIFAAAIRPDPERLVSEWADAHRRLGPEESPFGGAWRTDRVPYLREPMDRCSLADPVPMVTFIGSAQTGKTNVGLNTLGQIAHETPAAVLGVLPSIDEARAYNREKLQPMIDNSPAVRGRVLDVKGRDEASSTTLRKVFPAGSIELTGANSSKGLQMRTKRVLIMEEISEYPFDVDGRGDPVAMAEDRLTAWTGRGAKNIAISTPGIKGRCRITARYEASSRALFAVPCPHCGFVQPLTFDRFRWTQGQPETACYLCAGPDCGVLLTHHEKAHMLASGRWVHERPELQLTHAGYRINALYSPFVDWPWIARRLEAAAGDMLLEKVATQQVRGEAFEQKHDVVPHQVLYERRTTWPAKRIPPGILFLQAFTDVQGDRLEWGVYGFDRDFGQTWIDGGILLGDPAQDAVWQEHDELLAMRWRDAWGREWNAESWGVDTGYLSQSVYRYVRRHAHRGQPRVMALDGRAKWNMPPIGSPSVADVDWNGRKIGSVQLWPTGTWDLKAEIASALRLTEQGPNADGVWPRGAMRFPDRLDLGFFEQLTAEACVERGSRAGFAMREWIKIRARNEQLDIAVGTRALARHDTAAFTDADWTALAARRLGAATDLVTLMQSDLAAVPSGTASVAAAAPHQDAPATPPPPPDAPPGPAAEAPHAAWIDDRSDWFE
jgi:phage terminase large subunit GpA-like protein